MYTGDTHQWYCLFSIFFPDAKHTTGRGVTDKKTSLWASWVVEQSLERAGKEARRITVYHAG